MKHVYNVSGMTCNNCKASVEESLSNLEQVKEVSVNLKAKTATIKMTSHVEVKTLQDALSDKFKISEQEETNVFNSDTNESDVEKKSELKQLFPLFLIFGYLIIASILLNYKPWDVSGFMLDFMGLFYIVFSFFKLLDLKGFPESFRMYDPLAKVLPIYGWVYPFIELTLGLMFLMRFQIDIALIVTLIVLGITTVGVTKALFSKTTIQCACLGTALKLPMTKATFIENSVMIIMAILMLSNTLAS
ncbi:heavy-metal-associated domain-containing protein [Winogradskyella bathintestinalis]|uniref:Cation transporter n=1 Tax=Winogradskyella bathintestinalis TaxID=3035208 RepID=A0ABT7ZVV9_9FLAO|nr:MauE/DoxX family redox-associated membrane protein [Winogradskyella bathintestinalis]MDN3492863.1 cation transporter [Winogradskyella bathintestinalis]